MMLPGGSDLLYRQTLAAAHEHYVRVEVWNGLGAQIAVLEPFTGEPEGGLVFYAGALTATLGSRVTRTVNLTVPAELYPVDPTDALLSPYGHELRIFHGVRLGDGSDIYTWQVFRGRIRRVRKTRDGRCTVFCSDRAADVVDHKFVTPQNSQPLNTVYQEFRRLIQDAVFQATFGVSDEFAMPVQVLTWELERAAALDELATSASGIWYSLANGDFVLRRNPWQVNTPPVVTLSDVEGGTVLSAEPERNRDNIFNVVTVTGERLTGGEPVYATASDTNPVSPTFVGGTFGVRSMLARRQTPATQGAAQSAANALLAESTAPVEEWVLNVIPDAALELGDVVLLQVDGRQVTQVVSSFQLPIGLEGTMVLSTRSLVVNDLDPGMVRL